MEINLKDYYYWYITDELINVSEEFPQAFVQVSGMNPYTAGA